MASVYLPDKSFSFNPVDVVSLTQRGAGTTAIYNIPFDHVGMVQWNWTCQKVDTLSEAAMGAGNFSSQAFPLANAGDTKGFFLNGADETFALSNQIWVTGNDNIQLSVNDLNTSTNVSSSGGEGIAIIRQLMTGYSSAVTRNGSTVVDLGRDMIHSSAYNKESATAVTMYANTQTRTTLSATIHIFEA